jgi:glycosyltransferase involved in cell wall biosynthesis
MSVTIGSTNVSRNDRFAQVRVFVPTYRRGHLLPRALRSLRDQTFTDWTCEVHNNDPNDGFPAELVGRLSDPRIELHSHEANLGPTVAFNLFYRPVSEPFFSILEDDNWWEPEFLSIMIGEIRSHPSVTLAWCNQKIWEELPNGHWRDTGRLVNEDAGAGSRLVEFGEFRQVMGCLHANGAMIMRSHPGQSYPTPADFPFSGTEAFRERLIPAPLLYVGSPLAVFSRTIRSARSDSRSEWAIVQNLLAATFIRNRRYDDREVAELFAAARAQRPPGTATLICAALTEPGCLRWLRHSRPVDWLRLLRGLVARPHVLWQVLRSRRRNIDWWNALDQQTAARFAERTSAGSSPSSRAR